MKKGLLVGLLTLTGMLMSGCGAKENYDEIRLVSEQDKNVQFDDVSVHDPSVVKYNGMYYIFGSHLAGARSTDLMNWEMIGNGVNKSNPIIDDPLEEMKEAFEWAKTDTFWAPDVFQLEDGKFYMYYCNCEGSSPLACLGIAVSDKIEGPYKDLGIILRSGMTDTPSENGDFYDATVYPNVVDPSVYYDAEGRLWMMYGSYSGGIYVLELDTKTGFPLEKGYGKKILGGNHLRIEGSYVIYNPETAYYYMFLSFGGLDSDGGYNIRVCRSKTPDGPFYDFDGRDMIECTGAAGTFFDDGAAEKFGMKLMGNYSWNLHEGEKGVDRKGLVSPGHNSAIYDEESGKYFLVFHTRFEKKGEMHQVRVHQMFFNEEGWPVVLPYRYSGETQEEYSKTDIAGVYKFINHGRKITSSMITSEEITLYRNGSIDGAINGTWSMKDGNKIEITIDQVVYSGVCSVAYDEFGEKDVMTFTAASMQNGQSIWGSNLEAK